jgi:hypothetical protein
LQGIFVAAGKYIMKIKRPGTTHSATFYLSILSRYLQNVNSEASTQRYLSAGTEVVENPAVFRQL